MERYLSGQPVLKICQELQRSESWFYKWLSRYRSEEANWFEPHSRRPHTHPDRTPEEIEEIVKFTRLCLYNRGVFCGAQAILWELESHSIHPLPSLRTINRILSRCALTHRRTGDYQPKGKKYPSLEVAYPNQVHQADFVGPCYLQNPLRFYSLNMVDLATGRCAMEVTLERGSQAMINAVWALWHRLGLPHHLQVDNEVCFYGSPAHPRHMGALIRLCLNQGIQLWFVPPREPWRNGVIEKFNEHYRHRFLRGQPLPDESALRTQSLAFEQKHNQQYRYSKLQGRTPCQALIDSSAKLRFPTEKLSPTHPLPKPTQGHYHLIRFIRSNGLLDVFGEKFHLPSQAHYEYVRASVDVSQRLIQVFLHSQQIEQFNYPPSSSFSP